MITLDTTSNITAKLVPTMKAFNVTKKVSGVAVTQIGGQPFVCGGTLDPASNGYANGPLTAVCELYVATTGWTLGGALPYPVTGAAMTNLQSTAFIFGGQTDAVANTTTNRVLKYNVAGKNWTDVAPMPVPLM